MRAPGLVDQVDRLVREVAVGDVAVGEVGRRDDGVVGEPHRVVRLVAILEPMQDLDGVGDGGLLDLHRLETALQGGVLLEVLAVLLEGGGADGLQFAAGQHRLEDRGGVDGALGGAGADQGVDLVDEEEDVAAGPDLLEDLLQPLLEVAAVAGSGDERPQVERVELAVVERLGDLVGDDALGQTFDDGGLADARLTDQHRVVLGATGEDLHHPLDLAGTADDRVELALAGDLGEVAPELVEDRGARRSWSRAQPDDEAGRCSSDPPDPERSWMTVCAPWCSSAPSFCRTWAATPSPSRISPRRMCSVPM